MRVLDNVNRLSPAGTLVLGSVLIALIGATDYHTGYEYAFSLFYLVPITLITWRLGAVWGHGSAALSALVWLAADIGSGHPHSTLVVPIWNTAIRFFVFALVVALLNALRAALSRETALARFDALTGAVNAHHFYELAQSEIERARRYRRPFALAYIDLDNFKAVNDAHGHAAGDRVLRDVVNLIRGQIRRSDVVARLGGDEFVVLLPETGAGAAEQTLSKIRANLLHEMRERQLPVTFSIGILTCTEPPSSTDALVQQADALMYTVKAGTKDAIRSALYAG